MHKKKGNNKLAFKTLTISQGKETKEQGQTKL